MRFFAMQKTKNKPVVQFLAHRAKEFDVKTLEQNLDMVLLKTGKTRELENQTVANVNPNTKDEANKLASQTNEASSNYVSRDKNQIVVSVNMNEMQNIQKFLSKIKNAVEDEKLKGPREWFQQNTVVNSAVAKQSRLVIMMQEKNIHTLETTNVKWVPVEQFSPAEKESSFDALKWGLSFGLGGLATGWFGKKLLESLYGTTPLSNDDQKKEYVILRTITEDELFPSLHKLQLVLRQTSNVERKRFLTEVIQSLQRISRRLK